MAVLIFTGTALLLMAGTLLAASWPRATSQPRQWWSGPRVARHRPLPPSPDDDPEFIARLARRRPSL